MGLVFRPHYPQICPHESETLYLLKWQHELQVSHWILKNWWSNLTDDLFAKDGKTCVHAKYIACSKLQTFNKKKKVFLNKLFIQCLHNRLFCDISNLLVTNLIDQWIVRPTDQSKIQKIGIVMLPAFTFRENSCLWRLLISVISLPSFEKGQSLQHNH